MQGSARPARLPAILNGRNRPDTPSIKDQNAFVRDDYLPLPDVFWNAIAALIPIVVNLLAFTLIYRIVPKIRVHWREAFRGAVFATLMWEIGRTALAAFLLNVQYASAYRVIGSFIAVLL